MWKNIINCDNWETGHRSPANKISIFSSQDSLKNTSALTDLRKVMVFSCDNNINSPPARIGRM